MTKLPRKLSQTSKALRKTVKSLPAGLTGVLSSKREDWALSIGHLFQLGRNRSFLEILQKEWDDYVSKGEIKDGYEDSEQHKACLQELLDALDNDSPDKIRFEALKSVFLNAASEKLMDRDSVLPQQYMQICRSLTSGEILVISITYKISKEDWWRTEKFTGASKWLETIAKESGLLHSELVATHERGLIDKHLLMDRQYSDGSGIITGDHFRLTPLGLNFCSFIESKSAA